jgi:predicted RND superfamily exporter protein/long-subunit acyl-CoA synthetase (AMP-forming)
MSSGQTTGAGFAARVFDLVARRRGTVALLLATLVAVGAAGASRMRIDMSFRPTFTGDRKELRRTAEHEAVFGQVGFRDLVAIVDATGTPSTTALAALGDLAARLRKLPAVSEVRDPTSFPFFDRDGILQQTGIAGALPPGGALDSPAAAPLFEDLRRAPAARRLMVGDDGRRFAVMASLDIPNEDFARRRTAVRAFRSTVAAWSHETGLPVEVTGYPEVEQVYAEEILSSVLRSIGVLLVVMIAILFVYFRRWSDVATCLAGVTLSLPIVLGLMTALGQPFSIVNSQVLTLVLIVGIGQALHHQEEYRRRREAGRDHADANREAFSLLAWPSFMTGLATAAGFAALVTADMRAIWSFGLSTAMGVAVVYGVNWLVVPRLIARFYGRAPAEAFRARPSWTLSTVARADSLLGRHPRGVTLAFLAVTIALGAAGLSGLSIDQKVNEELPAGHPALHAETSYERSLAGFLGPELAVRSAAPGGSVADLSEELVAFVNRLCDMPEVRYVASPLDLLPQPLLPPQAVGKACRRDGGELGLALAARGGLAGPEVEALAASVLSADGARASVVVRVADIGTARSLPFVERIRAVARETMPHAVVEPVGQWWLAQQGMNSLSRDVMLSAVTALFVILPLMWLGIRDWKLFAAAIPPTVLPVVATLGFMGLAHITVRIGTAMILAIALGLAADDTVHLSVRIRDRVRAGCDAASAVSATLLRTGRPCSFSSYVLIAGFGSMTFSSLLALREMGVIAMFTMSFALAADVVLGPAIYLLLRRPRAARPARGSLRAMFAETLALHPERPALTYALPGTGDRGERAWRTLSWLEVGHLVADVADALPARPPRGEAATVATVAILADTDPRYPLLELAVGLAGGAVQPLYVSATDEELLHALATTGASVLVVGRSQRARGARLHPRVVALDDLVRLPGVETWQPVLPADVEPFDSTSVRARLDALPARAPEAALLFLQSTGTTGPARVIEISERAMMAAVEAVEGEASHPFPRFLSFLPTAHISERLLTLYLSIALSGHSTYGGGLATFAENLPACRPTVFLAPPLLLETLRHEIARAARAGLVGRRLLAALEDDAAAIRARGRDEGITRSLAARLFGRLIWRRLGLDRVQDALSGTAPLAPALGAWFEAAGLPFRDVYGQTELAGATSITARRGAAPGSVGRPARGVEVRISESEELLVRTRSLFTRYVRDEAATARVLQDGWLRTGDRARQLETGELVITGRIQSLVAVEGGAVVDLAAVAAGLRSVLGDAEVVLARAPEGREIHLYVACRSQASSPTEAAELRALDPADPRWSLVPGLLDAFDPRGVVRGWALFEGAFSQSTGELGPTGKPRGWRIHALRADHLRPRAAVAPAPRRGELCTGTLAV